TNGFNDMANEREDLMVGLAQDLNNNAEKTLYSMIILSITVIVLGVIFATVTANSISKPLKLVTNRMKEIASGNLTGTPFETNLADETGQLMLATNEMSTNLTGMLKEIRTISEDTSRNSDELAHSSEVAQSDTEQIAATMEELASGTETQARTASDLAGTMDSFAESIDSAYSNGEETLQSSNAVLQLAEQGTKQMHSSADQMQRINQIIKEAVS